MNSALIVDSSSLLERVKSGREGAAGTRGGGLTRRVERHAEVHVAQDGGEREVRGPREQRVLGGSEVAEAQAPRARQHSRRAQTRAHVVNQLQQVHARVVHCVHLCARTEKLDTDNSTRRHMRTLALVQS